MARSQRVLRRNASDGLAAEGLVPRVLLHFDIRATDQNTRRRVDRFLYGSRQTKLVDGRTKVYRYPGIIERTQGRHYGQSVVILAPDAGDETFYFLRGMKVPCDRVAVLAPDWV